MSRSSWKPAYLDPLFRENLRQVTNGRSNAATTHIIPHTTGTLLSGGEILTTKRSIKIAASIVGRRVRVSNGLRWVPLLLSQEMVGHSLGEFAPTRKRPVPPTRRAGKKSV